MNTRLVKIDQFPVSKNGTISDTVKLARKRGEFDEVHMTTTYIWYEAYKAALLETDWTKMRERIKAAESALHERQRVLSLDHGGTPEERQAIAGALNGIKVLERDAAGWQHQQGSGGDSTEPAT